MGSEPKPVPESNTVKARRVSRLYNQQKMNRNIPVRRIKHVIIHMSDDCEYFQVQSESLSAYIFENFMRFFRNLFPSCYMSLKQLFNSVHKFWKGYFHFPLPFLPFPFFSVMFFNNGLRIMPPAIWNCGNLPRSCGKKMSEHNFKKKRIIKCVYNCCNLIYE